MTPEELTDQAVDYIIEGMDATQLNDWERRFFESVSDQWHHRHTLSDRQREVLGKIWDRQK